MIFKFLDNIKVIMNLTSGVFQGSCPIFPFYAARYFHSHLGQLSTADYEEKANLNEATECL